jgi:hypothetical protein
LKTITNTPPRPGEISGAEAISEGSYGSNKTSPIWERDYVATGWEVSTWDVLVAMSIKPLPDRLEHEMVWDLYESSKAHARKAKTFQGIGILIKFYISWKGLNIGSNIITLTANHNLVVCPMLNSRVW